MGDHGMATIPFALEGGHVVIEASMNGCAGRFVLDTGSGRHALTPAFAEALGLALEPLARPGVGGGAGESKFRIGTAKAIGFGPLELRDSKVVVMADDPFGYSGSGVAGTLGYDVFARWTVEIDFAARRLTFFDAGSFVPPAQGIVTPIDLSLRVPRANVE